MSGRPHYFLGFFPDILQRIIVTILMHSAYLVNLLAYQTGEKAAGKNTLWREGQ
jgi:hypothetical protein